MNSAKQFTLGQIRQSSVGAKTIQKICPVHGEFKATVTPSGFSPECQKCIDAKDEEKQKAREQKPAPPCDIPKRFSPCRIDNFKIGCKEAHKAVEIIKSYVKNIENCIKLGTSLVLCGDIGSGKTHIACSIGHEFLNLGKTVRYTTTYQAVASVKETYRGNGKTEMQVIRDFQAFDMLILDEVGVQFGTDAEKIILYQIINGRYEAMKPMILISNLNEQGLSDYIGERCLDRLRDGEGAIIPFTWGSYRSKNIRRPM